jgi:ribosome biogenesis GTPase
MSITELAEARVVAVAGKRCRIELSDGRRVEAIVRGKLFEENPKSTLVVGDVVEASDRDEIWSVNSVRPRRNEFVRQGLRHERQVLFVNVDRVLILVSLSHPRTKPAAIDRFLVAAMHGGIPSALVLTKKDLDSNSERERELRLLYENFHLPVYPVCNLTGEGIDELSDHITSGITAVAGNSGVGKSSLLNRLVPGLELAVREVSAWSGKGTHTTSVALMITPPNPPANAGGEFRLIDTPGMKSFVPYGITKENLADLFPDIASLAPECRFRDCCHDLEPGCAVTSAALEGRLAESRLRSYQRMLAEIEDEY